MASVTLEKVDELNCKFSFSFKLDGNAIGYHLSVEFKLIKACNKKLLSFLPFVNDCDPPEVEPLFEWSMHTGTLHNYVFRGAVTDEREDESCKIFKVRWKCWQRALVNPVNPVTSSGTYKSGVFGKAEGEIEETPDWAGDKLFKVCCLKPKEGDACVKSCTEM